ncbi:MAG: gliding motility-associated C-terminal domain-containing protein [Flavobacteriales bacterium]|nr:gliding motility-associated C-terminal domain-containing protein [Flavobacteriales bacterium]
MKTYLLRLSLLSILYFTIPSYRVLSQFTEGGIDTVIVQVDQVLYGTYMTVCGPVDLTGYVVYDVIVIMEDPNDCFVGVFGGIGPDIETCYVTDPNNLTITFDGEYFNDPLGAVYGNSVNCSLCNNFPTICFDSWATLDDYCSGSSPYLLNCPDDVTPPAVFSADCSTMFNDLDFFIDNGGWFQIFTDGTTNDASYQIAQITTNDTFCMDGQISFQNDCQPGLENILVEDFSFCQPQPCVANPMDLIASITPAACFGDDNIVTFDDGGNGPVDYTLYNALNDAQIFAAYDLDAGYSNNTLNPGSYYIALEDSIGCLDSTQVFTLTEPTPFNFNAAIGQNIICFADSNGTILTSCSGGTPPDSVFYAGPISGSVACGDIISGLPTGTYILSAMDNNGCTEIIQITFANPPELIINIAVTDVSCGGIETGALIGTITGGTGIITANWTGDATATFTGPSPLTVTISNLGGGNYNLAASDASLCPVSENFSVFEPEGLSSNISVTNASCPGVCDGTVQVDTSGGTGTADVTITGGSFINLCPGEYIITITDDLGCIISNTVEVIGQDDFGFEPTFTNISCNQACDGVIDFQNITGSCGNYQYALSPATGAQTSSANAVTYSDLCAGTYQIEITDSCGCSVSINNVSISEPAALEVVTVVEQVLCFGNNNGSIQVSTGNPGIVQLIEPVIQTLPFTLENLAPDIYHIVIENENGCQDSTDVIITEPSEFLSEITTTTPVGCGGDCDATISVEYSGGTDPYSFKLLDAANNTTVVASGPLAAAGNDVIDNVCAGNWLLVLMDANFCSTDSLAVTIIEPDPIIINLSEDWITCTGMCDGSATVLFSGGTGELEVQIFPEDIDPDCGIGSCTFVDLCQSTYTVTVSDEAECQQDTLIVIGAEMVTDMILTLFSSPETCWNEMDGTATVAVTNGNVPINYQWNDPLQQTTATAVGLISNDVYTVIVSDAFGCTLTEQIEVAPTIGCFFIATALTPNGDGMNDDWLIGGLEYFPEATVQVFNRWSQVIFESRGYDAAWDGSYDGKKLPVADYYFVINYSEEADPILGTVTIKY